jgi:hypothetical protein
MLTGGLMVGGVFLAAGVWRAGDRFFQDLRSLFNQSQPAPKVDIRSVLVEQVRDVSELTTAVYGMQAVVPASRDRTLGGYVIGKTTLLYLAYGEVRAGVDLSKLRPEDVQVIDETVRLQLPPPEILDSKIDVNRSKVYDYDRGFMGLGPDSAPELQELAQQETLDQIVQSACTEGVLKEANERAELVVSQLLNTAGYRNFLVTTQLPNSSACKQETP